jgi:DNA-directed RNA polymerase
MNFSKIALWGRDYFNNSRDTLCWTLPDGFKASMKAYTKAARFTVKGNKYTLRMERRMPILWANNMPAMKRENDSHKLEHKALGLYANIIHSIDAYILRQLIMSGIQLMPKHDAYLVHPNDVDRLIQELNRILGKLHEEDVLRNIITQLGIPDIKFGDLNNEFGELSNFFSVE